jgi:hypothetical protein
MENMEKGKLNSGNILKYERNVGWIVERFGNMGKKSNLNSEKIWKIQKIVKRYEKYGWKVNWIVKRYGK